MDEEPLKVLFFCKKNEMKRKKKKNSEIEKKREFFFKNLWKANSLFVRLEREGNA